MRLIVDQEGASSSLVYPSKISEEWKVFLNFQLAFELLTFHFPLSTLNFLQVGSLVGQKHSPFKRGSVGSNPTRPTNFRDVA